jgi:hypothetical protein
VLREDSLRQHVLLVGCCAYALSVLLRVQCRGEVSGTLCEDRGTQTTKYYYVCIYMIAACSAQQQHVQQGEVYVFEAILQTVYHSTT